MSRCRFLVDECVPSALVRGMRRRWPEVSARQIGDFGAPAKGTPDQDLLDFCERERRLLITADRSTMRHWVEERLARGRHTWGVLVIGADSSVGGILEDLTLVYEASEDTEWVDVLYYLPLSAR